MLNWLKSLFHVAPAPRKTVELQAKLLPTNGHRLHGEAEFELYDNDGWELEAEVDFPSGERATSMIMYIDGNPVLDLRPDYDESEGKLSSRRGDILDILPMEGMSVEIRQGDQTVLTGTFELEPRFR